MVSRVSRAVGRGTRQFATVSLVELSAQNIRFILEGKADALALGNLCTPVDTARDAVFDVVHRLLPIIEVGIVILTVLLLQTPRQYAGRYVGSELRVRSKLRVHGSKITMVRCGA